MDAKPRSDKRSGLAVAILAVPALLAGYVLSYGPATRLMQQRRIRQTAYLTVYRPLFLIADKCGWIGVALDRYANVWRVRLAPPIWEAEIDGWPDITTGDDQQAAD